MTPLRVLFDLTRVVLYAQPMCVDQESKSLLGMAIWNDSLFLASLNVMDYSLLVGVDDKSGELVCGIIDYLRKFTWDKSFESWVKKTGMIAGGKVPTIISPKQCVHRACFAWAPHGLGTSAGSATPSGCTLLWHHAATCCSPTMTASSRTFAQPRAPTQRLIYSCALGQLCDGQARGTIALPRPHDHACQPRCPPVPAHSRCAYPRAWPSRLCSSSSSSSARRPLVRYTPPRRSAAPRPAPFLELAPCALPARAHGRHGGAVHKRCTSHLAPPCPRPAPPASAHIPLWT